MTIKLNMFFLANSDPVLFDSIPENLFCLPHIRPHVDAEGAAGLAYAALHAFPRVVRENGVMLAYRFRKLFLRFGQMQELRDVGDADFLRAWGAMAAIHAVPMPADAWEGGEGRRVVPLRFACVLIGKARQELFCRVGAR